jgi:polyphosphate glucokinase
MSRKVIGIDVGGSSIKAGLVDVDSGKLIGELISELTPKPASPENVMAVVADLVGRLPGAIPRLGLAVPSVVQCGMVRTAANIDKAWVGVDGAALAARTLGRPAVFLNDADAAGIAEMRWGAGRGVTGTAIMLTFGTGIGTALFMNGRLFPNTELGHIEVRGMDAEKRASALVKTEESLSWEAWIGRVNEYLERIHALFWPDVLILGGAVSQDFAQFAALLRSPAEIRPAHFAGQAGVIGAALAAVEHEDLSPQ